MYSIICCSINPEAITALQQNIAQTIGVPFEFIAFDNRETNYGICKVYNLCARNAKYDYLCFVHEDVRFLTHNWGGLLQSQLKTNQCGVIGFAGSIIKLQRLTGWNTCGKDLRANYVQYMRGGHHPRQVNPDKQTFSPVVTLDGLCLFVRRNVWNENPFDENTFLGFHCYDLDFSLAIARSYTNYVCHTVLVEHFSEGAFSLVWLNELKKLHKKWENQLPMTAIPMSHNKIKQYDRQGEAYFIKFTWQKGHFELYTLNDALIYLQHYPFYITSWLLFLKYLKYKIRYSKKEGKQNMNSFNTH